MVRTVRALTFGLTSSRVPTYRPTIRRVIFVAAPATVFDVIVQPRSGLFEIYENRIVVVSGRIYEYKYEYVANANDVRDDEFERLTKPIDEAEHVQIQQVWLDRENFYRFALMKECNFKGAFRSIDRINGRGNYLRFYV